MSYFIIYPGENDIVQIAVAKEMMEVVNKFSGKGKFQFATSIKEFYIDQIPVSNFPVGHPS
ncbi:hypothetical protein LXL04_009045 [Taraxacum kok-saghyz]